MAGRVKREKNPQETPKKQCAKCLKEKKRDGDFYGDYTVNSINADQRLAICKSCLWAMAGDSTDINAVKRALKTINRPYLYDIWESSIKESGRNVSSIFKTYMKNIQMVQNKTLTWDDSVEEPTEINTSEVSKSADAISVNNNNIDYLKEMYGYGFPDTEYYLFEKKFQQLKPSFQLVTTMHEEYLREYCINKVKETLAKARGDFKEAKDWAAMAKDSAEAGKLKPSQMSKADLSQGLDGFGQLARMVEERVDIIPILPRFVTQPKDKPDVVLWCYLNYVRDLKGLPEAEYKDIYEFYEERRADYERQELDNDPSMRVDSDDE